MRSFRVLLVGALLPLLAALSCSSNEDDIDATGPGLDQLREEYEEEQRTERRNERLAEDSIRRDWVAEVYRGWNSKSRELLEGNPCTPTPFYRAGVDILCNDVGLVTEVVDGDTLRLRNGRSVRLIGIDAPELYPRPECGATQAKQAIETLLTGPVGKRWNPLGRLPAKVLLKAAPGHPDVDAFGRLLRSIEVVAWLPTRQYPRRVDLIDDLGYWLLEEGLARFDDYAFGAYVSSAEQRRRVDAAVWGYRGAEKWAKNHRRGLWSRCW